MVVLLLLLCLGGLTLAVALLAVVVDAIERGDCGSLAYRLGWYLVLTDRLPGANDDE